MAATVRINRQAVTALRRMLDSRIGQGVRQLRDIAKANINAPFPPPSEPFQYPKRRTGGLRRAVFAARLGQMDWVFGYRRVERDPERPHSDRSLLGLWMELGTGRHRLPFPSGASSVIPAAGGSGADTAKTGRLTSMHPRPVLLPVLLNDGPRVLKSVLSGGQT